MFNRKNLMTLSVISGIVGLVMEVLAYFCFHFRGDEGFHAWQPEAGKPFVTDMIGIFGILMIFACVVFLMIAQVCYPKQKQQTNQDDTTENK